MFYDGVSRNSNVDSTFVRAPKVLTIMDVHGPSQHNLPSHRQGSLEEHDKDSAKMLSSGFHSHHWEEFT